MHERRRLLLAALNMADYLLLASALFYASSIEEDVCIACIVSVRCFRHCHACMQEYSVFVAVAFQNTFYHCSSMRVTINSALYHCSSMRVTLNSAVSCDDAGYKD